MTETDLNETDNLADSGTHYLSWNCLTVEKMHPTLFGVDGFMSNANKDHSMNQSFENDKSTKNLSNLTIKFIYLFFSMRPINW